MKIRWLIVAGLVLEILLCAFYLVEPSPSEVILFIGVYAIMFVSALWLGIRLDAPCEHRGRILTVILLFAALFRLTLLAHAPVASDDIYRYLWDGRVATHGINPFAYAPNDPALQSLRTEELPARVNFPAMRTIYPPLAQLLFTTSSALFGDSLPGLKFLLVLADFATLVLLLALLRTFAIRRAVLILYAWSPLPVLYFALDGHVDALGIPFLLLMLLLAARSKPVGAAFALGAAVLAKLHPLALAPLLARLGSGWRAVLYVAIPLLILAVACLPYLEPTGGLTESLLIYGATWEFNGSLFWLLKVVLHSSYMAHLASGIALVLWVGYVVLLTRPFAERVFLVVLGFFLLAPVVHPWYLTWLAALVVLRRSSAVVLLLGLSVLSLTVVYQYQRTGLWQENPIILVIEYLPVYVMLLVELLRGEFTRGESMRRFPLTAPHDLEVKS